VFTLYDGSVTQGSMSADMSAGRCKHGLVGGVASTAQPIVPSRSRCCNLRSTAKHRADGCIIVDHLLYCLEALCNVIRRNPMPSRMKACVNLMGALRRCGNAVRWQGAFRLGHGAMD